MDTFNNKYFLGANSAEGFVSEFGNCYAAGEGWRAFIIKGGPGTGKSSFMKYFAVKAADSGLAVTLCPCSSDPDSLDAVLLPERKIAVMDGTAPHVVEPAFPGVCETILNFGDFWDKSRLQADKETVMETTARNKALHRTASRYIRAAGLLLADNYKTALGCTDTEKADAYARRLCKRLIPKKAGIGREWIRFLGGITPKGAVSFASSLAKEAKQILVIKDENGSASHIIMERVRAFAIANGWEIITMKNPLLPSLITDHVFIPELSLAFVTENIFHHFDPAFKRVHARRFVSSAQLHASRERMKFNKKAAKELLFAASVTLAKAKAVHDELERCYIGAMRFDELTEFAERFTEKTLRGE